MRFLRSFRSVLIGMLGRRLRTRTTVVTFSLVALPGIGVVFFVSSRGSSPLFYSHDGHKTIFFFISSVLQLFLCSLLCGKVGILCPRKIALKVLAAFGDQVILLLAVGQLQRVSAKLSLKYCVHPT